MAAQVVATRTSTPWVRYCSTLEPVSKRHCKVWLVGGVAEREWILHW